MFCPERAFWYAIWPDGTIESYLRVVSNPAACPLSPPNAPQDARAGHRGMRLVAEPLHKVEQQADVARRHLRRGVLR